MRSAAGKVRFLFEKGPAPLEAGSAARLLPLGEAKFGESTLIIPVPIVVVVTKGNMCLGELRLELDATTEIFVGDVVAGRFEALATLLDLKPIVAARRWTAPL